MGSWLWEHKKADKGDKLLAQYSDVWVYASPWFEGNTDCVYISVCSEALEVDPLNFTLPLSQPTGDVAADAARYLTLMAKLLKALRTN